MRSFMAFNGRRPCPADGKYAEEYRQFRPRSRYSRYLHRGTPAAPLGPDAGTGYIVGGVIPTVSLGLPDEYQYDEFGRRFTYVVDRRATSKGSCLNLEALTATGAITGTGGVKIKNTTSGTVLDNTMYAYISHGASGYGAYPAQGASVTGEPHQRRQH